MPRVQIDPEADADLAGIANFIGSELNSPKAARRFIDDITEKFDLYAHHPEMGELRPELGDARCFVFRKKYVVVYLPLADGVHVLRVLHGRDYSIVFPQA